MRTEHLLQSDSVTAWYTIIIIIIMKIVLLCKTEQLTSASHNLFVAQFIEDTVNMGHRCDTHISDLHISKYLILRKQPERNNKHDIHSQPKLSL